MSDHDDTLQTAEDVLDAEYLQAMRIEPRMRRFARALTDLGAPVPRDWATADGLDSVDFGSLTAKQFDRLVCLLEDIAQNRPIVVSVMRGGPNLFAQGVPTGPVSAPVTSTVHIVVK